MKGLPRLRAPARDLFLPGELYLPTPAGAMAETVQPVAPAPPIAPAISLQWQEEVREVIRPFRWTPKVVPPRHENIEHAVFYIGVDAAGRVAHCLPDLSAGTEMDATLYPAFEAMEFTARPGAEGVDWVWVDVRW